MHAQDGNISASARKYRSRGESEKNCYDNPNNYEDRHCHKETEYFHDEIFLTPNNAAQARRAQAVQHGATAPSRRCLQQPGYLPRLDCSMMSS